MRKYLVYWTEEHKVTVETDLTDEEKILELAQKTNPDKSIDHVSDSTVEKL